MEQVRLFKIWQTNDIAGEPIDSEYIMDASVFRCKREIRATARKPRDAAAVLYRLKFANEIHYASLRVPYSFRGPNIAAQNRI